MNLKEWLAGFMCSEEHCLTAKIAIATMLHEAPETPLYQLKERAERIQEQHNKEKWV